MNTSPWHSSGNMEIPGGLLQWRWCGHLSKVAIDTAAPQLQQREELLNDFLKKQEDIISLFIQGLVQGPGVVVSGDSHDKYAHEKGEFDQAPEPSPFRSTIEEDRHCQENPNLYWSREEVQQVSAGPSQVSRSVISSRRVLEAPHEETELEQGPITPIVGTFFGLQTISFLHWWASLVEPKREGSLAEFERSMRFQGICAIVIALNTWLIVKSSDHSIKHPSDREPKMFAIAEACFLIFYICELILKLIVHRIWFFCNNDMLGNWFDIAIILISSTNFIVDAAGATDKRSNFTFLRTARLLRVVTLIRIFHFTEVLRDLRTMINCILHSFVPLMWCLALLALLTLVFSIFFVQSLTGSLLQLGEHQVVLDLIDLHFPSVQGGMLTLYMIATGGDDWGVVYRSMSFTGFDNCAMLLFFIGFFQVSIFNIATGLFVDKAMQFNRPTEEMAILEKKREAMAKVKKLKALCSAFDLDRSGTINRKEFLASMGNAHTRFAFSLEGLDIRDANAFFDTLAMVHGNVDVGIDEFLAGCLKMRGWATSVDLQTLGFELKKTCAENENLNHRIISCIGKLQSRLQQMDNQVQAQPFNEKHEEPQEAGRIQGRDLDLVRLV